VNIKKLSDAPAFDVSGIAHVKKRIVIGPSDGAKEIVLRYFSLESGGATPHHAHAFPHLVKIEAGRGLIMDGGGKAHQLEQGDYIYINDNETHQFKNTGTEPFEFICIVPGRGEGLIS
jgi:quercetin dioxygenase-like cupin family protein